MRLQLDVRQVGDVTVIKCSGRLVAGPEAKALDAQVRELLAETKHFVLHLGEMHFIDSTGLGTLVRLMGASRAAHGDLKLCSVPPEVAHTLKITNLHTVLEMYESEIEAVAAFYSCKLSRGSEFRFGTTILCLDGSEDMLACLRELLRSAGYAPVTTSSAFDARILSKATRPELVILGPNRVQQAGGADGLLTQALSGIPLLQLETSFSTMAAADAAQHLLEQVRSRIGSQRAKAE